MRPIVLVVLASLLAPALAVAQGAGTPFERAIRASAALELARQLSLASPALHASVAKDVLARRSSNKREGTTLMIIGGAAVVVGAVAGGTGGTVLIIGGVVCAGYGLYLYTE